MRWDAYCATIPARPEQILDGMCEALGERVGGIVEGKGIQSFKFGSSIVDHNGKSIGKLFWGGQNPLPHFKSMGRTADDCAHAIRARWPDHTVARADSCFDICDTDPFDHLVDRLEKFAHEHKLKRTHYGDWSKVELRDPLAGRTIYLGSRTSLAMLRVYGATIWVRKCVNRDEKL